MKYLHPLLFAGLLFLFTGCMNADPPLKWYSFGTKKDNLQKVVLKVIAANPRIAIDTTPLTVIVRRHPSDPSDTSTVEILLTDFHGRDSASIREYEKNEVRIVIKEGEVENRYALRYAGDSIEWQSSSSSTIFLQSATDKQGHTIIEGKDKHGEFNTKMAKDFILLFEKEFVNNIYRELNLPPVS